MSVPFTVTRDPASKAATLEIRAPGPWKAFAGKNAQSINFATPVSLGEGPGVFPLPCDRWLVFAVRQNGETYLAAERQLPMEGGYNFRDLGGMKGFGGKRTAWGKLFRTDDLQNLTAEDTAYLASIPVTTIVDFRTTHERNSRPDTVPASVKNALHYPIIPGNLTQDGGAPHDFSNMEEFMLAMYHDLVLNPLITKTYRKFFASVQKNADLPLLFHCAAGKDRTGFAAAMILFALGVDEEVIFADYEASNAYLGDKYAPLIAADPERNGLFTVKRAYLEQSLRTIEREHGNVENYLTVVLAVDIALLRARLLL